MKIDFYISSLSSGGAEHVMTNLATDFVKKGNDVTITSLEKRPQFYKPHPNVKIYKFDFTHKGKLRELIGDFKSVHSQIKKRKADATISFLSRCNMLLIVAGLFSKTKIIVCDRNNLLRKYPKYMFVITCMLYLLADGIVIQTHQMREFYPRFLQKKIFVLENPLDFDEMAKQIKDRYIKKENTILSIGRLEKQKDFKTLIKAFAKISEKYPDWNLKIFGKGDMRDELQCLIKELNLEGRAELCGVTHYAFHEMKKAKILVLSSFYEGFPNVLCEGLHAGLSCISTDCECGPRDLIKDGENGMLVPIADVDAMADRMEYLINSHDVREEMGNKAQKSVEYLELNRVCGRWLDMIKNVLNK